MLLSTPHPSRKLARWELILQGVDLVIQYRSGKKNAGAEAQSHLPVDWDGNGDSFLSEKQDDDNNLFVATTLIEDNAKSGERYFNVAAAVTEDSAKRRGENAREIM